MRRGAGPYDSPVDRLPRIAVTSGDPAGIGPEIVARLFARLRPGRSRAVLVGAPDVWRPWDERFGLRAEVLEGPWALEACRADVAVLDTGVRERFEPGRESAGGGKHAGRAIEIACELAASGRVAALVTAPISKKSLNLGGFHWTGHTEMLARSLNSPRCQMVMTFGDFRVVPLTRHLPLREVAGAITLDFVREGLRDVAEGIASTFGIRRPRLAVAGLNPHAGDGGVLGDEERAVIGPAIEAARADGVDAEGPFAADAMFQEAAAAVLAGRPPARDAYVAMYHDQGLVAFKALARRRGVNVTVGLPVPRTSVDHGAAMDIAGRGTADDTSLEAAYRLAETLCTRNRGAE